MTDYGKHIYLIEVSGPDLSSTAIRGAIVRGKDTRTMLHDAVRNYIDRENLYRS